MLHIQKYDDIRTIFNSLSLPSIKWSHYFDIYERHFSKFVSKSPVVVEVGIRRGGSAELWKRYFGSGATIVGIDINESVKRFKTAGCVQVIGDQGNPGFWDAFLKTYPSIDVFIDDGSHKASDQITTLECVWSNISLGGVYVCEDIHTSYWSEYGGGLNAPDTFMQYAKRLTDAMNAAYYRKCDKSSEVLDFAERYKEISAMHFYDSVVVINKDAKQTPAWVDSRRKNR